MKHSIDKTSVFKKLENFENPYLHNFPQNCLNPVLLAFELNTNLWH